jgi:hypothetical protein
MSILVSTANAGGKYGEVFFDEDYIYLDTFIYVT